jgi:integrase/recombinase XerD
LTARFTLKPSEIKKLVFHCQDLRERIIIRLMAHCGMRREEVSQISVDRIDWERNRVSFIGKMHRKHQSVPVPPDLMQDIKFCLAGRKTGYLLPAKKRDGHLTVIQINRIVAALGKRAGVRSPNPRSKTRNINPHLLRHTYARVCKDAGLTIEEVQGLRRHASFKTTYDLYGTINFEEIQKRYEEKFLPRL